jgi:excisionase family DNA binding protein
MSMKSDRKPESDSSRSGDGRITVTIKEGARLSGVSIPTFYKEFIHTGELPTIRIGTRRVIRRETLEECLRKRERGAA